MTQQIPSLNPSPWKQKVVRPSSQFPRHYLPFEGDFSTWESQKSFWEELATRLIPDAKGLRQWIQDWSEVSDAVQEESARRYIDMTCYTQDLEKEAAFLQFVETIEPQLAVVGDVLNRKLVAHPSFGDLPIAEKNWAYSVKMGIELYHESNIPLHTEIAKLAQSYQKIQGEMTVEWEGATRTLSQMAPLLQEPNRDMREKAWRLIADRRLKERDKLDTLFDAMLALRHQVAANLKLPDYVSYAFKGNLRTDYTPQGCFDFHAAVEKAVVPVYREALEERRKALKLDRLRPWDLSCDTLGRPPLKPFKSAAELVEKVGTLFQKLDPELHSLYQVLEKNGLMDLENRIGKAPGGYQSNLSEVRMPFIFMNAVGLNEDIFTLLHESGHAFHYLLARQHNLPFNRSAPMEFCEVASMAMERLGARYLNEFYTEEEKKRAIRTENEEVFRLLPWVATIDAFQHWIYTTPHTPEQRRDYWLELDKRFGSQVDWSGLEEYRGYTWHRQLHIFEIPFYYIEYGIAQLGALQVWDRSLKDLPETLRLYKHALSQGGTLGLRQLFTAAGLQFDLTQAALTPLVEQVRAEWLATL